MWRRKNRYGLWVLLLSVSADATYAQDLDDLIAMQVLVPQRGAATVMGDYIRAQATYTWSQGAFLKNKGQFLESSAKARLIRAQATEKEMENSVKWVETYFERKLRNRQYRDKLRPPRAERNALIQNQYETKIREQPEAFKEGDPTEHLNWLLNKLSSELAAHNLSPIPDPLMGLDVALSSEDVRHLYFNDGSAQSPRRRFRNQAENVLTVDWPSLFLDEVFDPLRSRYETLSSRLLESVKDGGVRASQFRALQDTLDQLTVTMQSRYPLEMRRRDPRTMKMYLAGKRFIRDLAKTVFYAQLSEPQDMLLEDQGFDGLALGDLLRHMNSRGLFFASPEKTGRATYYKLFDYLHKAYFGLSE